MHISLISFTFNVFNIEDRWRSLKYLQMTVTRLECSIHMLLIGGMEFGLHMAQNSAIWATQLRKVGEFRFPARHGKK